MRRISTARRTSRPSENGGRKIVSAILALLIALAPEVRVEAEPLDANRHMLAMDTEARSSFQAAQAALLPTATRLCADRTFFLGAFKFADQPEAPAAKRGVAKTRFQQELYCSIPQRFSGSATAGLQDPPEAQQQAVLKATYAYLAAKDSNRLSDAYAMFSPRAKLTAPDWVAKARDFNEQAGAVRARRVTDISWYSNPPEAPEPGLYVAADLNGAFENVEFLCGYVVWKLDADGSFRVVREEQNFVERRRGAKLALPDGTRLRAQMGCKN